MPRFHRTGFATLVLSFALATASTAVAAPAATNPDYAKANKLTVKMAESLESYDLKGTVSMTNNVKGQTGGATLEAETTTAARWPDRLFSRQTGKLFNLNLGTGPQQSWFYLGQLGNAYMGPPVKLTRDLQGATDMELTEAKVFNFYGGIGQFILDPSLRVTPETGSATVTVNGRDIPCQVFTTMGPEVIVDDDQISEGPRIIHFDPASGLVLKSAQTVYFQKNGVDFVQQVSFTLTEYELNGNVDDARFGFEAPAGVRVVNSLERLTNPDAMTNEKAPDITFTGLDGSTFRLSDLRGQPVFIDFWATWCPPCKMEMPHIETLYKELGESGKIRIIAASSEDPETIRKFLRKTPYSFPIVTVDSEVSHARFKTNSIPAGFVIDAEGVIRAHMVGAQSEEQLRAAFAKAGVK